MRRGRVEGVRKRKRKKGGNVGKRMKKWRTRKRNFIQ